MSDIYEDYSAGERNMIRITRAQWDSQCDQCCDECNKDCEEEDEELESD